jgi:hypothetical protein
MASSSSLKRTRLDNTSTSTNGNGHGHEHERELELFGHLSDDDNDDAKSGTGTAAANGLPSLPSLSSKPSIFYSSSSSNGHLRYGIMSWDGLSNLPLDLIRRRIGEMTQTCDINVINNIMTIATAPGIRAPINYNNHTTNDDALDLTGDDTPETMLTLTRSQLAGN